MHRLTDIKKTNLRMALLLWVPKLLVAFVTLKINHQKPRQKLLALPRYHEM